MSELQYHYGLKVRIYPSDQQKQIIKVNSDASRFIYNELNGIHRELYQLRRVKIYIKVVADRIQQLEKRAKSVREIANVHQWLFDPRIDSLAKADARMNYYKAWNMFHQVHSAGIPKFHKKSYEQKYQTNGQYPKQKQALMTNGTVRFLDGQHVLVPKIGRLRVSGSQKRMLHRTADTRIGTVTVSKDAGDRYFLSLQLASDEPFVQPAQQTGSQIGIDLNIDNFLTDSNGKVVANPRYYRAIKGKLAQSQRKLSRRALRAKKEHRLLRHAKNYQKQRLAVARLHHKVCQQRQNFLQHLSTALIKSHDLVVAEELRSKNMLKNRALALSISDVGWRSFLQMLTYKADLYGHQLITVSPHHTTQTCSDCGYLMCGDEKLTLGDREWTCPQCGTFHIRDHNAARNILHKGLASL